MTVMAKLSPIKNPELASIDESAAAPKIKTERVGNKKKLQRNVRKKSFFTLQMQEMAN